LEDGRVDNNEFFDVEMHDINQSKNKESIDKLKKRVIVGGKVVKGKKVNKKKL